jgi:hypothetical protein
MNATRSPLRDRDLVELLSREPELLAIADALVATQRRERTVPRSTPVRLGRRWVDSAHAAAPIAAPRARTQALRRLILGHRLALALAGVVVLVAAIVAVAVFPRSPQTSNGLTTIGNRGTPDSFVAADRNWGKAYVLADLDGLVYFRVERPKDVVVPSGMTKRPTCYGQGRLRSGQVEVLMVDCSAFPSARTPVLKWISEDASAGGGTLLSVSGIAADGVAEMRLVSASGDVIARTPVERNVYRFKDVGGLAAPGVKLVAADADGHEVWSGPSGG